MSEDWRSVLGYEGFYEVSDLGRVRGVDRTVMVRRGGMETARKQPGKILSPAFNHDGYSQVLLRRDGKQKMVGVHRLVALAFHGEKRNALHNEVAHLDGSRTNARADNLKWVSKRENMSHKRLHGTAQVGERHPRALLTNKQVRAIKQELRAGAFPSIIARECGVSVGAIADIATGRNWRSV